jgi:MOSC domain-containing protein YiiM
MDGAVVSVNVGAPRTIGWLGRPATTSIWKEQVKGRVRVAGVNVAGDDQADRSVHGGPDEAVYAYAREDQEWWERELARPLPPGVFGENLTVRGLDVTGAVVGERWQAGGVLVEVSSRGFPAGSWAPAWATPPFPLASPQPVVRARTSGSSRRATSRRATRSRSSTVRSTG